MQRETGTLVQDLRNLPLKKTAVAETVAVDPILKRQRPSVVLNGVVLRMFQKREPKLEKSKTGQTLSCTLEVLVDQPLVDGKTVQTDDNDGKLVKTSDTTKLILNNWHKVPKGKMAERKKLVKLNDNTREIKVQYEYAIDDATPETIKHGSIVKVSWLRSGVVEKDLIPFALYERVRIVGLRKETQQSKKDNNFYPGNRCTDVQRLGQRCTPVALASMLEHFSYTNSVFKRLVLKLEEEKPAASAAAAPVVADDATPAAAATSDDATTQKDEALNVEAATDGAEGHDAEQRKRHAKEVQRLKARMTREQIAALSGDIWFMTHPVPMEEQEKLLLPPSGVKQRLYAATYPKDDKNEAWIGTRKEQGQTAEIKFPMVHLTTGIRQITDSSSSSSKLNQKVVLDISLSKSSCGQFGIQNEDMRSKFLRFLVPRTPFIGVGYADLLKTSSDELSQPMAPDSHGDCFRIVIQGTAVFPIPARGIIDSCFEVSAEYASIERKRLLLQEDIPEGGGPSVFTIRKEFESITRENPLNLTGEQYPPFVNFTESPLEPLNVVGKYKFFVLLECNKEERYMKKLDAWTKKYGPDRSIKLFEKLLLNHGDEFIEDIDGQQVEFSINGITSKIADGDKVIFGVRIDEYDRAQRKLMSPEVTMTEATTTTVEEPPQSPQQPQVEATAPPSSSKKANTKPAFAKSATSKKGK